jgi:phenylalanyl-tRNA synthetase beta chain
LHLTNSQIISSLKKSRLDATLKGENIICSIPSYRFDIFGPMDLVEEVTLGYGIQNLEPILLVSNPMRIFNPLIFYYSQSKDKEKLEMVAKFITNM